MRHPAEADTAQAELLADRMLVGFLGMADRLAVMHNGTIVGNLSRAEATPEKVLSLALGQQAA